MTDLAALERGAGRRRAGPEAVARAQEDLAVGADVHGDADLGALVDARGERHGDRVGADEARDDRQQADARLRRDLQEQLARRQDQRVAHDGGVGREPHVRGVDAEQDVVHARVADDDDLVDPLGEDAGLPADLLDVLVQEAHDPRVELPEVGRVELREGDPRHEVAAEDRLGVQARHRPEMLVRVERQQRGDDARRADVHREPELHARGVAPLDGEHAMAARGAARRERRHRDAVGVVAERRGQALEHARPDVGRRQPHGGAELLEVRGLVVLLAGQGHLDELLLDSRVQGDPAVGGRARAPAEDLERQLLERRRHLDRDGIARHALAGEPVALAHEVGAELDLVHDRGRRHGPGHELDPARRAAAPAAAGGGDVDTSGLSGFEDRRPRCQVERAARPGIARLGQDRERDGHVPSF